MAKIQVKLIKPESRTYYLAQWLDPITGKTKTKSTKSTARREAERFAARLEDRLNNGETIVGTKTQWDLFKDRYDTEVMAGQSPRTREKAGMVFEAIEAVVNPRTPDVLDANQISQYVKSMREAGRSEATIKGHLAYLKAALRWAEDMGIIAKAPKIKMPSRVKNRKGRAITAEELDRLIEKTESVVGKIAAPDWNFLIRGLWWSGLRRSEAWHLHWTDDSMIRVDLSGRRPMFRIQPEADKGFEARTFPIAPQFAEMLYSVPESDREGYVFNPCSKDGRVRVNEERTSRLIGQIGKAAGVKVGGTTEKPKFASAHDLRRSFGTRWAKLVMPAVLQQLMRHSEISTTMQFYVTQNAEATADAVWNALEGNTSGNTDEKTPNSEEAEIDVNPYG